MKLQSGVCDWKVSTDLMTSLQFPILITRTDKRSDVVMWSDSKKSVFLIELTILLEENIEEAHERKKSRHGSLRADCMEKGRTCSVMPNEMRCRGFLRHSVVSLAFKNRHLWSLFENCVASPSNNSLACFEQDLVMIKISQWNARDSTA